jgi:hypothetical protein
MSHPEAAQHLLRHSLTVGVMLDDVGFRRLLSSYVDDLRERFPHEALEDDTPNNVLDNVISRLDPVASARTGGAVYDALSEFARRRWRLDLSITTSDFGLFEKRDGPYRFDRAQYHLGRSVVSARAVAMHPSTCPYSRSRHLPLEWARSNAEHWIEVLPDTLWWAVNEAPNALSAAMGDDSLADLSDRLTAAEFELGSLGLYLTTLETVHQADEQLPQ